MSMPRPFGAYAAVAAGALLVLVATVAALTSAGPAPDARATPFVPAMGAAPIAYDVKEPGAPIAYDVQEHQRSRDRSVPSASSLQFQNPAGETIPSF